MAEGASLENWNRVTPIVSSNLTPSEIFDGGRCMPLPAVEKKLVEQTLSQYCEKKIPLHVRDKVRLNYRFRGNSVTLFEERPAFNIPDKWVDISVAQFRYEPLKKLWTLYCADRNSRWHKYYEVDPAKSLQTLLDEVEEDPTGIFWG